MPPARRTTRLAEIVRLFGHSAGGRPSERLMARLGMPVSDTTILRSLKKGVAVPPDRAVVRVVGVDEWAWRKGTSFGTVISATGFSLTGADSSGGASAQRPMRRAAKRKALYVIMRDGGGGQDDSDFGTTGAGCPRRSLERSSGRRHEACERPAVMEAS